MLSGLSLFLSTMFSFFPSQAALQVENLALRHQIGVLRRSAKKRPKLTVADRFFGAWLSGAWADWRSALIIVKPETVIVGHRKGFRLFWTWKIRHGRTGRPAVSQEVRDLIRTMSRANTLWGAPRIHGELLKLGIDIGETSVSKFMVRSESRPAKPGGHFSTTMSNSLSQWTSSPCQRSAFRFCTCFWCWPMKGGEYCTSTLRLIRLRNGPPSNFAMRSPGTRRHAICCEMGIESLATTSPDRSTRWEWSKCFVRRDPRGTGPTSSA
jgi:hypothetical protein